MKKKAYTFLLVFLLAALLCAPTAFAAGEYADAGALYNAWHEINGYDNPYPPYVCGVWSLDGTINNLMIAVTEDAAGEAGKQEILDAIADDDSVRFTYQRYTYAELLALQEEIIPLLGSNGINGCGTDEMRNLISVYINQTNPGAQEIMNKLSAQYGDMIAFELTSENFVTVTDVEIDVPVILDGQQTVIGSGFTPIAEESAAAKLPLSLIACMVFLLLLGGGYLLHKLTGPAAVTTGGTVVNHAENLNIREIETCLEEDCVVPSEELDNKILSQINEKD